MSRPLEVELPRSMVEVVINWNQPMSRWLHTCEVAGLGARMGLEMGVGHV